MADISENRPNAFGQVLLHHRRLLVIVALAGAMLGALLSLGSTPQYAATAVVYAAGEGQDMRLHQGNTLILQQLFNSSYLRDTLIARHQLQERYGIDPAAPQAKAQTYQELNAHLSIDRSVFNSLEITATDPDPSFVAQLANSAARLISAAKDQLIRENKAPQLQIIGQRVSERRAAFDSLMKAFQLQVRRSKRDSLRTLQKQEKTLIQRQEQLMAQKDALTKRIGYSQLPHQQDHLLQTQAQLEQRLASLDARHKAATADSTRARLDRLRKGLARERAVIGSQIKQIRKSLPRYRKLQENIALIHQALKRNRAEQNTLRRKKSLTLAHDFSRQAAQKAYSQVENQKEAFRQGQERLDHPPRAAYLASKAVAPAEPSRPIRILWAFLGALVLSTTTLLYLFLRQLWTSAS